jgi:hypothetical protein
MSTFISEKEMDIVIQKNRNLARGIGEWKGKYNNLWYRSMVVELILSFLIVVLFFNWILL